MSIDDVVVIMSIPRRLVLRIRYPRSKRAPAWLVYPDLVAQTDPTLKPVVVVKRQLGEVVGTPALSRVIRLANQGGGK